MYWGIVVSSGQVRFISEPRRGELAGGRVYAVVVGLDSGFRAV